MKAWSEATKFCLVGTFDSEKHCWQTNLKNLVGLEVLFNKLQNGGTAMLASDGKNFVIKNTGGNTWWRRIIEYSLLWFKTVSFPHLG